MIQFMSAKPKTARAPGKVQTSIALRRVVLKAAKAQAAKDGRTFNNWLEVFLSREFGIPLEDGEPGGEEV